MNIALITGASSGMGQELVRRIADCFPSIDEIWITARREERLLQLRHEFPGRIRCFPGGLTEEDTITEIKAALERERPVVRILGNAAGFGKIGRVGEIPAGDTAGMLQVNCMALTALTEAVLPFLKSGSRILNFASAAAFLPQPGFAVYAATKAYVLSYSLALGRELSARGITVTAVCPGPVATEFFSVAEENAAAPAYKRIFMAKTGRVVDRALLDARYGKAVSVYGLPMQLFRLIAKLLPHGILLRFYERQGHTGIRHERI
ncbi:MAG: SDR family NAD(P)-dependent oxidoreductase [Stomatobaculum sp.]